MRVAVVLVILVGLVMAGSRECSRFRSIKFLVGVWMCDFRKSIL